VYLKKFFSGLIIGCFVFLILPVGAGADEIEFKLFETKAKAPTQFNQAQHQQSTGIQFGLRLIGGTNLLMENDLNNYVEGMNNYLSDFADTIPDVSVDSEFEPIKMGMDFSGEILIHFMPQFGIGIGAGYISTGKESMGKLSAPNGDYESITMHPQVSAIPITFSLYYGIPLGNRMEVVLNGGLGYYLGTINYEVVFEGGSPTYGYSYEETETWDTTSNAFGFHGGLDFEFGFSSNFAFVVGARGRLVKFTDLTGDLEWEYTYSPGGSGSGTDKDQTLWYGIKEDWMTGNEYVQLTLSEDRPTGSSWSDVRKAEISLSGFVFQAGIKLTF